MELRTYNVLLISLLLIWGCQPLKPIRTVDDVDLQRFMGDWYVIASIPTFIEKGAHNGIESYRLADDGTIETTFTFRKGSLDGPEKILRPRGFVRDKTANSVWDMQFLWPFKAEYRIVYLNEDYSQTIIGRTKRDYVWIMARHPWIPEPDYQRLVHYIGQLGYDVSKIKKVPQRHE